VFRRFDFEPVTTREYFRDPFAFAAEYQLQCGHGFEAVGIAVSELVGNLTRKASMRPRL